MKKMSRLSLIVRGKEVIKELFSFKTRKISNAVDSAIAAAGENAVLCEMKSKTLISKFAENYDEPAKLNEVINEICAAMDEAEEWKKKEQQVKKIKEMLEEEVEVEE